MNTLKLIILTSSIFLAACGGDGQSSKSNVVPAPPAPIVLPKTTYYTPDAPKSGDRYEYKINSSFSGGATNIFNNTKQVGYIQSDGSFYLNSYFENRLLRADLLDKARNILESNGCSYAKPFNEIPLPWYVGEIAQQNTTINCSSLGLPSPSTITANSQILGVETITVAAGTFKTLKIHNLKTNDFNAVMPASEDSICWNDIQSGFQVKCTGTVTYDLSKFDTTSTVWQLLYGFYGNGVETYTHELTSIQHADASTLILTGKQDNTLIQSLYLTDKQRSSLGTTIGHTVELDASKPVNWTLDSSGSAINLVTGNQTVTVAGVMMNISMNSTAITINPFSAPIPAPSTSPTPVILNFKGKLATDPSKTVSVSIEISLSSMGSLPPITLPISSCFGGLKFC